MFWARVVVLLLLMAPARAEAHTALSGLGSFWAGALHPLLSIDQLAVLLALAVWLGPQQRRADTAVAAVGVGALLGAFGAWAAELKDGAPFAVGVAMTLSGAAGAAAIDSSRAWVAPSAAGLCGLIVGAANAAGVEQLSHGLYALGAALAAASIAAHGLLAVSRASHPFWVRMAARVGAGVVAASGVALCFFNVFGWRARW
jgi:urease accessory protein